VTAAGYVETYRGTVYRWELDQYDHFTVAFYFQRFGDAGQVLLESLGLGRDRFVTADVYVHYISEFHAGDLLHIETGVIELTDDGFVAGHKVFDSTSGALTTTVEHRFAPAAGAAPLGAPERRALDARRVAWDVERRKRHPQPVSPDGFREGSLDVIKPAEMDADGRVGLAAYIHRFSGANGHVIAAFGMTPEYMTRQRRGFSTFEFQFAITDQDLRVGDTVRVRSALVHVGSSSMRVQHRMRNERTGKDVATLEQFAVHLDMDARKSTPLPDALRAQAQAVLVKTA
jgi:acyl-CoA thioesterase FadM